MLDMIGAPLSVEVDRPLGTPHPDYPHLVYRLNYGFLPSTLAPDLEEIDVYVMGVAVPLRTFNGSCIAVIERLDDIECKLVAAPCGMEFSDEEILAATDFQEGYFRTRLHRKPG